MSQQPEHRRWVADRSSANAAARVLTWVCMPRLGFALLACAAVCLTLLGIADLQGGQPKYGAFQLGVAATVVLQAVVNVSAFIWRVRRDVRVRLRQGVAYETEISIDRIRQIGPFTDRSIYFANVANVTVTGSWVVIQEHGLPRLILPRALLDDDSVARMQSSARIS